MSSKLTCEQSRLRTKIWPSGAPEPAGGDVVVNDPELLRALCLDWDSAKSEAFIARISRYGFKALSGFDLLPAKDSWCLEEGTSDMVQRYLLHKPLADIRDKRYMIDYVKPSQWRKVIDPDEDVILIDYYTHEIFAVVLRDFVDVPSVLKRFDKAAAKHIEMGRNVRVSLDSTQVLV